MDREAWQVISFIGLQRVRHDWSDLAWMHESVFGMSQGPPMGVHASLSPLMTRTVGRLASFTMGGVPSLFDLQGAFLCLLLFFSHSVVLDSLWPHGLQHARLSYPSPTPGACSNSCPSSRWCHPTISSSVLPFSSCLQSFPASGSFQMSQLFASGGQSTGASASASVLLMNIQNWSPLG